MLFVLPEEEGTNLKRFLEKRLLNPSSSSDLHKWIRTGQVRVNGKRSTPFLKLTAGDEVRVPPFALARTVSEQKQKLDIFSLGKDLSIIASCSDYMVLNKASGLAVQGGLHIKDSVVSRLQKYFAQAAFIPAPVHRLDRVTSGLLLVASQASSAKELSFAFTQKNCIGKKYFALVPQTKKFTQKSIVIDSFAQIQDKNVVKNICTQASEVIPYTDQNALNAILLSLRPEQVAILVQESKEYELVNTITKKAQYTLLEVDLFTGKKHQIRIQLAQQNLPIVTGYEIKQGGVQELFLHAYQLSLPDKKTYTCLPDWVCKKST